MKKIISITCILISALLCCACGCAGEIEVNDSYGLAKQKAEKYGGFEYGRFIFYKKFNKNFVIQIDEYAMKVEEIYEFKDTSISDTDIDSIKEGMSVVEVVKLCGNPVGSLTSGMRTLDFKTREKNTLRIYFDSNMNVVDVYLIND